MIKFLSYRLLRNLLLQCHPSSGHRAILAVAVGRKGANRSQCDSKRTNVEILAKPVISTAGGIVARFHNESIPGERGVDFDYVRASVTFRGRNIPSIVFTDSPKWLHRNVEETIHIAHNQSQSMILAMYDVQDSKWVLPFIRPAFLDDGAQGKELDVRPLPYGPLSVQISLTSDADIGLPPFNIEFELLANGKAKLPDLTSTQHAENAASHSLVVQGLNRVKIDYVQGFLWTDVDTGLEAVVLNIENKPAAIGQQTSTANGLIATVRFMRPDGTVAHVMSRAYWLRATENRLSLASGQGAAILVAAVTKNKLQIYNNPRKYRPRPNRRINDGYAPDLPSAREINFEHLFDVEVIVIQEDSGTSLLSATLRLTPTEDGCSAVLQQKSS